MERPGPVMCAKGIAGMELNGFDVAKEVVRGVIHGLAQGVISETACGDFKSGFLGASLGHFAGRKAKLLIDNLKGPDKIFARTAIAAVAGGTAANLGGGKFANGAVSAAFVHLFNNEMHRPKKSFYDGFNKKFLADFEATNPVEHSLFKEYALNIDASLWGNDLRHFELAWRNFALYAQSGSIDMLSMSARDLMVSVYGPQNILSAIPEIGSAFGLYNDAGSLYGASNYAKIYNEVLNIRTNGPQVINQGGFTKLGLSYDSRLNSLVR